MSLGGVGPGDWVDAADDGEAAGDLWAGAVVSLASSDKLTSETLMSGGGSVLGLGVRVRLHRPRPWETSTTVQAAQRAGIRIG
ncbi:hypothetical protein [Caulobacter sp. BP25]|uniref:hypothetical protein n=1 Tax=Caulobacter sp. BP25 TaxID=2048900 RepID=UPI0013747915|nr:hypothetical protein [Caulobacter sp. BP25]